MNNKEKERKGIPFLCYFLTWSGRGRPRRFLATATAGSRLMLLRWVTVFFEGCFGGFGLICLLLLSIDLRWNGFVTVWFVAVVDAFVSVLICYGVVLNSRSTVMLRFGLCRTWLRLESVSVPVRLEYVVVELLCVLKKTVMNWFVWGLVWWFYRF